MNYPSSWAPRTRTPAAAWMANHPWAWPFTKPRGVMPWPPPSVFGMPWQTWKKGFPQGLHQAVYYDTTPFIKESVNEVFNALRDAVIFGGHRRPVLFAGLKAMILPMIDVPVSLIGTLAIMLALGFTLNNLTLFGLVLAIGIVVDDAIVVLENVERWMEMAWMPKRPRSRHGEITGPIIAITLVLCSVLLPVLAWEVLAASSTGNSP